MAGLRIRWRAVGRVAAILAVGLIALRLVPTLLRAPEPPPLSRDVGLPKVRSAASGTVRVVKKRPRKPHRHVTHHEHPHPSRDPRPASKAKISSTPRPAPEPPPEPVESGPPPAPEYVSPPVPEPSPTPVPDPPPAPRSVPGDGSEEFAAH